MPSNIREVVGQKPWRAIGAWLLTCYLVGLVVIGGGSVFSAIQASFDPTFPADWQMVIMSPLWSVPAGFITAAMTALPVWSVVSILRATRWPRPLCEVVLGLILNSIFSPSVCRLGSMCFLAPSVLPPVGAIGASQDVQVASTTRWRAQSRRVASIERDRS